MCVCFQNWTLPSNGSWEEHFPGRNWTWKRAEHQADQGLHFKRDLEA